jgi:hypothetical protein
MVKNPERGLRNFLTDFPNFLMVFDGFLVALALFRIK